LFDVLLLLGSDVICGHVVIRYVVLHCKTTLHLNISLEIQANLSERPHFRAIFVSALLLLLLLLLIDCHFSFSF